MIVFPSRTTKHAIAHYLHTIPSISFSTGALSVKAYFSGQF